jgi:hypothetical protein
MQTYGVVADDKKALKQKFDEMKGDEALTEEIGSSFFSSSSPSPLHLPPPALFFLSPRSQLKLSLSCGPTTVSKQPSNNDPISKFPIPPNIFLIKSMKFLKRVMFLLTTMCCAVAREPQA